MKGISKVEEKWWIAYNDDKSIIRSGYSPLGSQTTTMLTLETFDTESEQKTRLAEI